MAFAISNRLRIAGLAGLGLAAFWTLAHGQTMSANSAAYNAGYGRYADEENQPVNVSMTDANGNLVAINGMFQASGTSIFAGSTARLSEDTALTGAGDTYSGAGSTNSTSASAIGNNLNVVVDGSDNIVVVKSEQSNTGDVTASASTSTNGKN